MLRAVVATSIIAGGPAPIIALGLWAGKFTLLGASFTSPFPIHNPYTISAYILVCCLIGFIAVALLKDRSSLDHTVEYDEQAPMEAEGLRRRAMG